jgi:hypothetical protein
LKEANEMLTRSLFSLLKSTLPLGILFMICAGLAAQEASKEPIAYIGHGAMFDQQGNEVAPTLTFIQTAQAWYLTELRRKLTVNQRALFGRFERDLSDGILLDRQSQLVLNTYLLDWLLDSGNVENGDRIRGKNNLVRFLLRMKLSENPDLYAPRNEPFEIQPKLRGRLKTIPQRKAGEEQPGRKTLTTLGGQLYREQCAMEGVPIPPDFGPGSGWVSRGLIPQSQLFIVASLGAEVLTWQSASPVGMCIALPRFDTTTDEVGLDGIICMGKVKSKVCFWDNEKNGGIPFTFPRGSPPPFTEWGGGSELRASVGGVCTACHAGENPYIIHPATAALGSLSGLGLPTFPNNWYDPIVTTVDAEPWPENPGPMNSPQSCRGCHFQGFAGRFPHLSPALTASNGSGYCNTILRQAINRTMPPSAPGSLAGSAEMTRLLDWCGIPATKDASGRGDPHITTFDGIRYDFQSAGEFVYLRDEGGLEIQTRQTPVATTFIPGVNPYTGLASCVSLNTAVAARVGSHRISYEPEIQTSPGAIPLGSVGPAPPRYRLDLRIDGQLTMLGRDPIDLGNGGRILNSRYGEGIEIYFPDKTHLVVTSNWWESQKKWYLNVDVINTIGREGIMGAVGSTSWLPILPTGLSFGSIPASLHQRYVDLNQTFANAWRVTGPTSLFDYAPGTSTLTFTNTGWPPESGPCTIPGSNVPPAEGMDPVAAAQICSELIDPNMRADCIFDVSVTGEAGFAKSYLTSQKIKKPRIQGAP